MGVIMEIINMTSEDIGNLKKLSLDFFNAKGDLLLFRYNNVLRLLTFNHENSTSRFSLSSSMKTYDSANLVSFQKVVQDFDINTYDQLQNLTNLQIQLNK